MTTRFKDFTDKELGIFVERFKKHEQIKLVVDELTKNEIITSEKINVLKAKKYESADLNFSFLVLMLEDDKVRITAIEVDDKMNTFVSIKENNGEFLVLKIYKVIDGKIEYIDTKNYEDILKGMESFEQVELPENLDKKEVVANLKCMHGNWCGPGCSGPGKPIDAVDSCCKQHDICYGNKGYFACSCDRRLIKCLKPWVAQGSEWAIVVTAYFKKSPCNPFK